MRRLRSLLLLALVPAAGGCGCFTGEAGYRSMPAPMFRASSATPGTPGAAAASATARLDAARPVLARRSAFAAAERADAFASRADVVSEGASQQTAYRDPQKAFCFACLIAGGGHFYTGEKTKGAVLLGVAAAGLIGGAVLSGSESDDPFDCEYDPETFECEPESNRTPLLIGAGVAAASWVYGIIDSRASAARVNARNGHQVGSAFEMRPVLGLSRAGKPGAALHFRVRW